MVKYAKGANRPFDMVAASRCRSNNHQIMSTHTQHVQS